MNDVHLQARCDQRIHCVQCRGDRQEDAEWRLSVFGDAKAPCPWGYEIGAALPSRGLGDTIEKITSKLRIKSCGGCKRRRNWLNKKLPYGSKD